VEQAVIARWALQAAAAAALLAFIAIASWQLGLLGGMLAVLLLHRTGVL
jgi:hypothetical protein